MISWRQSIAQLPCCSTPQYSDLTFQSSRPLTRRLISGVRPMKNILAIVLALAIFQAAEATSFYEVTIPEVFKESQIVVFGTIEAGRTIKGNCGVEYAVRIVNSFKGASKPGDLVWFQNQGPTQIGAEYFLFLSSTEREFIPMASTNSGDTDMHAEYLSRCQKSRPPFVVNVFGNGALKSVGTYNKDVPRAVLIDDVVLIPPDGLKVTKFKPYDRYDNDRGDTGLAAGDFMEYMNSLSKHD